MHTTPVSLLERLHSDANREAWDRFVELYTPLLYHWARRFHLDEAAGADFVQDVFTILVRDLPRFTYEPSKRFRGWLWTVAVNKWREHQRRIVNRPKQAAVAVEEIADSRDAECDVDDAEYQKYIVNRALQLMQADFQPVTWKACWEYTVVGRPAAEIAAELGITVNNVHLAKSRVLRRLREELHGLLD